MRAGVAAGALIQGTGLASKSLANMLIFKKKILIHGTTQKKILIYGTTHLIFQLCMLFSARQEKSLKK